MLSYICCSREMIRCLECSALSIKAHTSQAYKAAMKAASAMIYKAVKMEIHSRLNPGGEHQNSRSCLQLPRKNKIGKTKQNSFREVVPCTETKSCLEEEDIL